MNLKHTLGIWEVKESQSGTPFVIAGKLTIANSIWGNSVPEMEANAKLIASSPELLSALSSLVALIANQDVTITRDGVDIEKFLASSRSAIARATA